jgi:hypothetical protein
VSSVLKVDTLSPVEANSNISIPNGVQLYAPGTILQVQVASSGPLRQTITSITPIAVDGLSVTFTPKLPNSRILVQAQISTTATYVSSFAVYKNNLPTVNTTGFTNNNEPNMNFTSYIGGGNTIVNNLYCLPLAWSEFAGGTEPRNYTIFATSGWSGTAYALYINDRNDSTMASFSYMTVTEIAQ